MRRLIAESEKIDDTNKAANALADFLARRDHSLDELRKKLGRRFSKSAVEGALALAQERRWLPDPDVLAERVSESLHRKNKGALYIRRFLKERGLPGLASDESKELEKGYHLIKMKFGEKELTLAEKQKAYRFLAYRGFEDRIIKKVIYEKP